MSKVWFCPNCGYEVPSRGKCHACGKKLVASAMPSLKVGDEDDEVGYRLEGWENRDRGRLIERLNHRQIAHRFEEDELVISAEDEERVDDIVADLALTASSHDRDGGHDEDEDADEPSTDGPRIVGYDDDAPSEAESDDVAEDDPLDEAVQMLFAAAERLEADPTDMQADADVAEASAQVFIADGHPRCDAETWAAVGRVTRRLLAVLGAEEALEDKIKLEAGILSKLLAPVVGREVGDGSDDVGEQTVYEMAEWMPEQRVQLGILLKERAISFQWDGDDLIVPASRESEVEDLFTEVIGSDGEVEDDDETRYQAVAELFAASGRLAADPSDEARADLVLEWVEECQGPPLLGMDEVDWFRIMSKAKALVGAIETADVDIDAVREGANSLHDLLRSVV